MVHLSYGATSQYSDRPERTFSPGETSSVPYLLQHPEGIDVTRNMLQARDWINESLYDTSHGYFSRPASPVGQLPDPIQFSQLSGQQAYLQHLRLWYDTLKVLPLPPALQELGPLQLFKYFHVLSFFDPHPILVACRNLMCTFHSESMLAMPEPWSSHFPSAKSQTG